MKLLMRTFVKLQLVVLNKSCKKWFIYSVFNVFVGCKCPVSGALLKDLFQTENFRVTVVPDVYTVEICGALKVTFLLIPNT